MTVSALNTWIKQFRQSGSSKEKDNRTSEEVGFQGGIIIVLMIGYVVAWLDKYFNRVLPDIIKFVFTPMLTILVSSLLLFTIIGPFGRMLGDGLRSMLDCISAFSYTDFRGDLAKFNVPTLILHGNADAIVPVKVSGKKAHEQIAGSKLVVIEGGPHGFNATVNSSSLYIPNLRNFSVKRLYTLMSWLNDYLL